MFIRFDMIRERDRRTDRETDRQTDGQTPHDGYSRAYMHSIARQKLQPRLGLLRPSVNFNRLTA